MCIAACIATLQASLLLPTTGKRADSFVVLDLMRLPLGILSGMGFIGAGVILRKGDFILGVTTAATLWFVTVIGLCFGGGQLGLGIVGALIAVFVLSVLTWVEQWLPRNRQGSLRLTSTTELPMEEEIRATLAAEHCSVVSLARSYSAHAAKRELSLEVRWRARAGDLRVPVFVEELARLPNVIDLDWKS